jgi:hypothetical protein
MEAPVELSFGAANFGAVNLGDRRRERRLVSVADELVRHPDGTWPKKLHRPADLKALYRLMDCDVVTHQAVLAPATARTRQRMAEAEGTVLVIHDWTELDYTGLTSLADVLGQIGNGSRRGYVCANALAVVAETREVLGLAAQILFHRPTIGKGESPAKRRMRADRESRLWRSASEFIPAAAAGRRQVEIADRGGDVLEFLDFVESSGKQYLVRSKHDRRVSLGGLDPDTGLPLSDEVLKLHAHARTLTQRGTYTVSVPARPGQKARLAKIGVAWDRVTLRVPDRPRGETREVPLQAWIVVAREIDPPPGAEPIEWLLLTNVPVNKLEDALERIRWYECRWIIEEYHKVLKTGCGIEQMQFTTEARLQPAIALIAVTAVQLLNLRDAARRDDAKTVPATNLFPLLSVIVLSLWRYGERREDLSVHDFCYALARLGGHQNRKGDGHPGWLTLWRGWSALQCMLTAAQLLDEEKKRCG